MDIKIKIVPNPLYGQPGSLVENPYIGQVIHTGTVTAADVCEACKAANPQMTEPLASLATETILDYGSDRVVSDIVRFNLGSAFFTLEPAVSGSIPTIDAALTDANERYIRVVNGQSLNKRIEALRPVIVDDDLGDVMFRSTEATHAGEEYRNAIFGSEQFVALGKRLGGEGQTMKLVDETTGATLCEATFVSGDALGQRFAYTLAEPPAESRDGALVLTSVGKDTPDAKPKTIKVKVKYVKVTPPEDPVRFDTIEIVRNDYGVDTALTGAGLDQIEGYSRESGSGKFTATVYVNGTESGEVDFTEGSDEIYQANLNELGLEVGDTVKIEAPVASAPGRVQTKVEGEATVEEA